MISASVPDNERVLKLLLSKGADVNEKSEWLFGSVQGIPPTKNGLCRFLWQCTPLHHLADSEKESDTCDVDSLTLCSLQEEPRHCPYPD